LELPSDTWWETKEWRERELDEREPITKFRSKHIYENYDPNSEKVKQQYGWNIEDKILLWNVFDKEKVEERKMNNIVNELNSLWIFYSRYRHIGTIWGGNDEGWSNFTPIGKKYLDFVNITFKSRKIENIIAQ
jgi:hypothetical protein